MLVVQMKDPIGRRTQQPTPDQVRDLLGKGLDFWRSGSGDAGIKRIAEGVTSFLVIQFNETNGYHLKYQKVLGRDGWLTPRAIGSEGGLVDVVVGGEPTPVPLSSFLARTDAEVAVNHFIATGEPWPLRMWVDYYQEIAAEEASRLLEK
jgi:hypothetical protein